MLTKEEVLHVLDLARLDACEDEIKKYQVELKKMINEIDKIKEFNDFDDDIMIAPWNNNVKLRENEDIKLQDSDVLLNIPNKKGNFVVVDVGVLKDE